MFGTYRLLLGKNMLCLSVYFFTLVFSKVSFVDTSGFGNDRFICCENENMSCLQFFGGEGFGVWRNVLKWELTHYLTRTHFTAGTVTHPAGFVVRELIHARRFVTCFGVASCNVYLYCAIMTVRPIRGLQYVCNANMPFSRNFKVALKRIWNEPSPHTPYFF
jgi:hypothetical protein